MGHIYWASLAGGGAPPKQTWVQAVQALPSLWAWWRMDDTISGGNTVLADHSGNGRTLLLSNVAMTNVAGLLVGDSDGAIHRGHFGAGANYNGNWVRPAVGAIAPGTSFS